MKGGVQEGREFVYKQNTENAVSNPEGSSEAFQPEPRFVDRCRDGSANALRK
jgi:hypothetical protein